MLLIGYMTRLCSSICNIIFTDVFIKKVKYIMFIQKFFFLSGTWNNKSGTQALKI